MKIIVVGNDKIGELLVQQLSREGREVVVVNSNPVRPEFMQEKLGVTVVPGSGASIETLREAGAGSTDSLITVANSDEVNPLTALVTEKSGCNYVVVRVRSPEYDREINLSETSFGVNVSINPEKACAEEIFRLLQFPAFLTRNSSVGGRAEMVEFIVPEEGRPTGRKLSELTNVFNKKVLICTIERNGEVLVPSGFIGLHTGDKLGFAATTVDPPALLHRFGIRTFNVKNVTTTGGSVIARYLVTDLLRSGLHATILKMDLRKCEVLGDLLLGAVIIHSDGSLQYMLTEKGIANTDAVVLLTGIGEEDIIISLCAHSIGTKKAITKVNRMEYMNLFGQEYLGAVMSLEALTTSEITRYARTVSQMRKGSVETLHTLDGGSIESLGFAVPEDAPFVSKPIVELPLQPSILIASTIKNQRVIALDDQGCLMRGGSIVMIAGTNQMVSNLTDIFRNREGEAWIIV